MSRKKRVLIIDRDKNFGEMLARNFAAWGLKPEIIATGADALKKRTSDYLLITTEINLPIVNGKTLLEAYAKLGNNTSVLVLTDFSDEKVKSDLVKFTFVDGWFNKPVDMRKLKNYVFELLNRGKADYTRVFTSQTSLRVDDTVNIRLLQRKIHGDLSDLDETQIKFSSVGKSVIQRERDGMYMIRIPEGFANIGTDNFDPIEKPVLRIFMRSYYIDKFPVTNAQYAKFMRWVENTKNPHVFSHQNQPSAKNYKPKFWNDERFNQDDQPVVGVDWFDAYAYSRWANNTQDYDVLPTEFQWEYAARGDSMFDYPWGKKFPEESQANFGNLFGCTTPVDKFDLGKAQSGVYDMSGNVWEWCLNWFLEDSYKRLSVSKSVITEQESSEISELKVLRGGSFINEPEMIRVSNRGSIKPTEKYFHIGFRCCAPLDLYR